MSELITSNTSEYLGDVMTNSLCPPWNDPSFVLRLRRILIWSSETFEADAECLKESSTNPDGDFESEADQHQYEFEMRQVEEINSIKLNFFAGTDLK